MPINYRDRESGALQVNHYANWKTTSGWRWATNYRNNNERGHKLSEILWSTVKATILFWGKSFRDINLVVVSALEYHGEEKGSEGSTDWA